MARRPIINKDETHTAAKPVNTDGDDRTEFEADAVALLPESGIIEGYSPIAQFDLDDTIDGYFYPSEILFQETQGYSYYLGDNSGLVHSYVDEDVNNGRTYYYSLVEGTGIYI